MQARRWKGVAVLAAVTALLAGFASGAEAKTDVGTGASAASPIKVGIVYSRTGLLATYGAQYIQGLRYGLAYATKGTMRGQRAQDRADGRRRRHRRRPRPSRPART